MKRIRIVHPGDGKIAVSPWMDPMQAERDLKVIQNAMENGDLVKLEWFAGEANDITSATMQVQPSMPRPSVGGGRRGFRPAG